MLGKVREPCRFEQIRDTSASVDILQSIKAKARQCNAVKAEQPLGRRVRQKPRLGAQH